MAAEVEDKAAEVEDKVADALLWFEGNSVCWEDIQDIQQLVVQLGAVLDLGEW